ncbi:MAG: peptidoglycan DD-metalloendopeptidase family protein [bacterium]
MTLKFSRSLTIALIFVILFIIIVIGFLIPLQKEKGQLTKAAPVKDFVYKIKADSLNVKFGRVGNNQNLSTILSSYISNQMIDRIARATRDIFDVRKIRSGGKYALVLTRDSVPKTQYFIYEINDVDFVVYDFRDSLKVYRDKKKVTKVVRTVNGTISSSLWNAFAEQKLDMNLGMTMADVYAWTVDFYGLQKGDHFRVIYEEYSVQDAVITTDRILASVFTSGGKDFYAFYYEQAGHGEYFDENGQSLRRSFLKAPLRFSRISSRFSKSRMHPILRIARPHFGVDYAAPRGTPVVSLGDGRVAEAGWHGGYGRFISIRHNTIYTSTYAHLSQYEKGIKPGVRVRQGQTIGYVGSSGLSTGAHLDFRVYKNGVPTDPLKMESPPAEPVKTVMMKSYLQLVAKMKAELDKS